MTFIDLSNNLIQFLVVSSLPPILKAPFDDPGLNIKVSIFGFSHVGKVHIIW